MVLGGLSAHTYKRQLNEKYAEIAFSFMNAPFAYLEKVAKLVSKKAGVCDSFQITEFTRTHG